MGEKVEDQNDFCELEWANKSFYKNTIPPIPTMQGLTGSGLNTAQELAEGTGLAKVLTRKISWK